MAIAVQFTDRAHFTANMAFEMFDAFRGEYPTIELADRMALTGLNSQMPIFQETSAPRWWFSSESGERLIQAQDDAFAVNWRRRAPIGQPTEDPYPGHEAMLGRFEQQFETYRNVLGLENTPPIATVNLHYENVWLVEPARPLGDYFNFWRTLGIQAPQAGPEIRWSIMLDDKRLGPNARIDVNAARGAIAPQDGPPQTVARLVLSAFSHPGLAPVRPIFEGLHEIIAQYLELIATKEAREAWNV